MKLPEFPSPETQELKIGKIYWSVARLIQLAKDLPVMEIPLDHLNVYQVYKELTLRKLVMHMKTAINSDLDYPIILDEDGDIMDGRHRIMKALYFGKETIKAVKFQENPTPCRTDSDD